MQENLWRSREARKVTLLGFWMNAVLTVCKIAAGVLGNSTAMIADGVHSLSDFLTDIVVLVSFKWTEKPEDDDHNYGHGKFETLATLLIALFLAVVGFRILTSGIANIMVAVKGGELPSPGVIAAVAAFASIVSKEFLYRITVLVGRRIHSSAVIANAWHHRSDAFSSIGTCLGIGGAILLGSRWTVLDPIASVAVSGFIFKAAYEIFMPAVNELMESSLNEEEKKRIVAILEGDENVRAYHHLRTRRVGTKAVIELHIEVDGAKDIKEAHGIASDIETRIKYCFGGCIVTIHMDPYRD